MQLVCNNYDKCSEYCEMLQNNLSNSEPFITVHISKYEYERL